MITAMTKDKNYKYSVNFLYYLIGKFPGLDALALIGKGYRGHDFEAAEEAGLIKFENGGYYRSAK